MIIGCELENTKELFLIFKYANSTCLCKKMFVLLKMHIEVGSSETLQHLKYALQMCYLKCGP